ncbi:integrator complex subunit 12-like [Ctenocephalides felis]|uniref:integrator complex subunit 12-like n=1 Tax=Ctenocephalides felis TaxID=7515 RepID=UPI000E6E1436|nr:integrator complex subunit 12-like [Ctenocephalides felis]XP_026481078.1 integrator complex subunit 12-like [Ctenocephalides felis]XP_026481170.1 integrator complex subunit 12-like [Ctenocephalides felis]
MSNGETECALRACRLLQSNSADSAELIRLYLDEAIKQKYGSHKTLTNALKKEILDEEQKVCGLITACDTDIITSHDDSMVEGLKNLLQDDLTCIICRGMDVTAGNRLVECSECHSLYHQECHRPHIPENDVNDPDICWSCSECKIETSTSVQKSYKDRSKESSKSPASSSGYTKLYSGSSSKSKSESSTKSSSSSPTVSSSKITPHIKILTPDKHAQNLKRKASKQGESKKKH